ncbi:MAG: DUF1501 domain-containing protein [Cephaloticoccus sp.]|nr:DUF1501 domain-containing protein [Cephaloticoccus sp.]
MEPKKTSRREFVKISAGAMGLLSLTRAVPALGALPAFAPASFQDSRRSILVLIQLVGGNDGLNTVIPFTDDRYYRLRPTLAVSAKSVLKLTDSIGLHPACRGLRQLYHEGQLAIIQGVGYAQPNRSHFGSTEIWETGNPLGPLQSTGWLGRYFDAIKTPELSPLDPVAVHFSHQTPGVLVGQTDQPVCGFNLQTSQPATHVGCINRIADSYRTSVAFPDSRFGDSLRNTAALIAADTSAQVYHITLGGFDTHSHQANAHYHLLKTLSEGLSAFQNELQSLHLDDRVLTMTYSEFGRRAAENERLGTDHGTAMPVLLMSPKIKGGVHGESPPLPLDANQDLGHTTEHIQLYGTVLESWLGCPNRLVFDQPVQPLAFI